MTGAERRWVAGVRRRRVNLPYGLAVAWVLLVILLYLSQFLPDPA